ncbi:MAG: hypothetical protein IJ996_01195 [Clostridia bacterium]|nr:hypothetical protein [Clostridia bacterium]
MLTNLLYIDPAATSILLTSISAIVVAVGATFVIIWNKMKKKVCKTLHIDENAHKEVEDDIVITDDEVKDEVAVADADDKAEEPAKEEEQA